MPKVLDGAAIAAEIKQDVAEAVKALAAKGVQPGLAVVRVGHVPASEIYVRNKVQTSKEMGFLSEHITPPETVTTEEMLAIIAALNGRDDEGECCNDCDEDRTKRHEAYSGRAAGWSLRLTGP